MSTALNVRPETIAEALVGRACPEFEHLDEVVERVRIHAYVKSVAQDIPARGLDGTYWFEDRSALTFEADPAGGLLCRVLTPTPEAHA
jgi:hypothetical protein